MNSFSATAQAHPNIAFTKLVQWNTDLDYRQIDFETGYNPSDNTHCLGRLVRIAKLYS